MLLRNASQVLEDLRAHPRYKPLEKQIELLQVQREQGTVTSPVNGTVLQIAAAIGERTGATPLIEIADLSSMVCAAEVHESDVAQVRVGQKAELKSAALQHPIRGKVTRIDRVVGPPQMRSPNPLARSDFRSIPVWIQIDPEDTEIASQRLQLQVEVSIEQ